jgi:hypothetical protein
MVVSGAPEYTENHAKNVTDLGLGYAEEIRNLKFPCDIQIQVKIGIKINQLCVVLNKIRT